MEELLLGLIEKYPGAAYTLMVIGSLRVINKPLFSMLKQLVDYTAWTEKDNALLQKIIDSKAYKYVSYVLDYLGSFKVPQKKAEKIEDLPIGEQNK
ncbi:MAG: hypothetical protein BWY19_00763 [bacterium ADurb.Bin212]|nr:MAG: hypothetical protein BWY19_00763 [bacterium ADurb.Bin212]